MHGSYFLLQLLDCCLVALLGVLTFFLALLCLQQLEMKKTHNIRVVFTLLLQHSTC